MASPGTVQPAMGGTVPIAKQHHEHPLLCLQRFPHDPGSLVPSARPRHRGATERRPSTVSIDALAQRVGYAS